MTTIFNSELLGRAKRAFVDAQTAAASAGDAGGGMPPGAGGGMPPGAPMDPMAGGGAMPPGMPMDPMAGAPMDPMAGGGGMPMPPGAPMDPMAGGAPPADPQSDRLTALEQKLDTLIAGQGGGDAKPAKPKKPAGGGGEDMWMIKKLLVGLYEQLGMPIDPQLLLGEQPEQPEQPGGDAAAGQGGEQQSSSIQPIQPIGPAMPEPPTPEPAGPPTDMPKAAFDRIVNGPGQAAELAPLLPEPSTDMNMTLDQGAEHAGALLAVLRANGN